MLKDKFRHIKFLTGLFQETEFHVSGINKPEWLGHHPGGCEKKIIR